ncbi:hypothetical protein [Kushneria konosiri]|uniref:hypothetical protein n=1 Tax=Kushneria konosiri TaxID=698828 RepID=UPI0011E4D2AE|nr:hypothetical protein [Kushneria konosiri]
MAGILRKRSLARHDHIQTMLCDAPAALIEDSAFEQTQYQVMPGMILPYCINKPSTEEIAYSTRKLDIRHSELNCLDVDTLISAGVEQAGQNGQLERVKRLHAECVSLLTSHELIIRISDELYSSPYKAKVLKEAYFVIKLFNFEKNTLNILN